MYRNEDDEDLRVEIFHLKKQLSNVGSENNLLKVKIRKLQNEITKKDKQMDTVLDPRKSTDIRKILYERSASFVINMQDKNDELLQLLHEKDMVIRRLQNQLDVTRSYTQRPRKYCQCKCSDHGELEKKIRQIQMKIPCFKSGNFNSSSSLDDIAKKKKYRSLSWTPELQEASSTLIEEAIAEENAKKINAQNSTYDVKDQYKSLSRDHLLSIIESLKNNQRQSPTSRQASSRKSSPESDLDRIELLCESPHEEIQQLHFHFLDMISEVDHLKNTIALLQNNQEKTEDVLKRKDTNMDKLVQEIKNLKRPNKSRSKSGKNRNNRSYSSTDLVARVYSANSNKTCSRHEKEMKNKVNEKPGSKNVQKSRSAKHRKKNVMTQVDGVESPEPKQCVYVEKGSITITQKTATSQTPVDKEYAYDDEVFEECEEVSAAASCEKSE